MVDNFIKLVNILESRNSGFKRKSEFIAIYIDLKLQIEIPITDLLKKMGNWYD